MAAATVSVVTVSLRAFAFWAEIAELISEFGVEAVFEADLLDIGRTRFGGIVAIFALAAGRTLTAWLRVGAAARR